MRRAALALLLLLLGAAPARADSIVFVRAGDVWLTSPDGGRQYQVTTGGGWDAPSQADDGTIVAQHGQQLVRMDRSGRVLGQPFAAIGGATSTILGETAKIFGPNDPEVSPDGRRIAYWATAYDVSSTGEIISQSLRDLALVTPSDRLEVTPASWVTSVRQPSWIGNERVAVSGSGLGNMEFETWVPGIADGLQWWFRNVDAIEQDWELSRDGRRAVAVAQTNGALSTPDTLHFFTVPGPAWTAPPYPGTHLDDAPRPPAGELRCQAVRDSAVENPSFSPDGAHVAFQDRDGVWVQDLPELATTCAAPAARLLVAGAEHPDWGPADVDPSQAPSAGGPGPAPAPGPAAGVAAPALRSVTVPASARRRTGLRVTLRLRRAATAVVRLCRGTGRTCRVALRRTVRGSAGTTRVRLTTRRLRPGRYTLRVSVAGSPEVRRIVRLR